MDEAALVVIVVRHPTLKNVTSEQANVTVGQESWAELVTNVNLDTGIMALLDVRVRKL